MRHLYRQKQLQEMFGTTLQICWTKPELVTITGDLAADGRCSGASARRFLLPWTVRTDTFRRVKAVQ